MGHVELFAAAAREGLATLLSGMGADEMFGGYDRFVDYFYRQRRYARHWRSSSHWFDGLLHDTRRAAIDLFPGIAQFFDERARARVLSPSLRHIGAATADVGFYRECRRIAPEANVLAMMGAHEAQHRIPDLLMQGFEPVARAAGVQTAYPFLDREVAHLAMTMDVDDHFWFERGAWWAKRTLRAAARGIVPGPIVMRRRIAYDVPIARWLGDRQFGRLVVERLASTRLWDLGMWQRTARTRALREARALTRGDAARAVSMCERTWALLTLGAWYDRYVAR
jgi:asparagine synthetase B (glutamine-hydrolysing)